MDRQKYGSKDSHSMIYSEDPRVMKDYSADQRVVQNSHSDYGTEPRVMQFYYASDWTMLK